MDRRSVLAATISSLFFWRSKAEANDLDSKVESLSKHSLGNAAPHWVTKFEKCRELRDRMGQFDDDDYLIGMFNGAECLMAEIEDREPEFADCFRNFPEHVKSVKKEMQTDNELAWVWHCNIAMPIQNEGVDHKTANAAAARVMKQLFGADYKKYSAGFVHDA